VLWTLLYYELSWLKRHFHDNPSTELIFWTEAASGKAGQANVGLCLLLFSTLLWSSSYDAISNFLGSVTIKLDRRLRPLCCHLWGYFKHTSFSCGYIRVDITCKLNVINIQHAHCGLVGPEWLQELVTVVRSLQRVFLCAKLKAACVWALLPQLGGDVEQPISVTVWVQIWRHPQNGKYVTYHYTVRGGRATAIGNVQKKFGQLLVLGQLLLFLSDLAVLLF